MELSFSACEAVTIILKTRLKFLLVYIETGKLSETPEVHQSSAISMMSRSKRLVEKLHFTNKIILECLGNIIISEVCKHFKPPHAIFELMFY